MRPGTRRNQRRQPQPARARPSAARPAAIRPRLLRFPPCWAGFGKSGPFRRPACSGGCASRPVGPAWGSPAPFAARPAAIRPRLLRFPPCWAGFGKPGPFRRPACGHPAPAAPLPALLGGFGEAQPLSPPGLRPSGPNRPGEAAERTCFPLGASPSAMQREAFLPAKPARKPPISRAYRLPGWGRPVPMGMLRLGPRLVGPSGGSWPPRRWGAAR